MNFHSLYDQGFARVAAVTLPVHPARPFENAREIIDAARERFDPAAAERMWKRLFDLGESLTHSLNAADRPRAARARWSPCGPTYCAMRSTAIWSRSWASATALASRSTEPRAT